MTVVKSTKITLADNTASGIANGELVRNGALLEYHDGTSSRVLVGRDTTDTLTNKTINTSDNTITVASADVTGLSTSLADKAPIASPTFTGTIAIPNIANLETTVTSKAPLASPTFTGTVVLPNVPAIVTTQLDLKSPLASPTFTGTVTTSSVDVAGNNIDNVQNVIHDISAMSGTAINFDNDQVETMGFSATLTLTTSNRAIGRSKTLKMSNTSGSTQTLNFPAGWIFVGAKPTDIAGNKTAILTCTCFGTADTDIVSAYAVEA
jgi:hypothetical protein